MGKLKEAKSTVIKIRDNTTWGKIMYSACYAFNKHLAEHWLEYCIRFDDGEVLGNLDNALDNANAELENIKREKAENDSNVADSVHKTIELYKQYGASKIPESIVANYRRNKDDANVRRQYEGLCEARRLAFAKYNEAMAERREFERKRATYNTEHSYESKRISNRITAIKRKLAIRNIPVQHPVCCDFELLNNFILSEQQTEKLMGLLLSILAINTSNAFISSITDLQRAKVCEKLFEFLDSFKHIYDFATGCYEERDGVLQMKSMDVLAKTFYNGYYITLKGYCLRAFMHSVKESETIVSVYDLFPETDENEGGANRGFDRIAFDQNNFSFGGYETTNEDIAEMWLDVANGIRANCDAFSSEIRSAMQSSLPQGNYYETTDSQAMCKGIVFGVVDGILFALREGRNVPSRLKNIVLDASGGVESRQELDKLVQCVTNLLKQYMREFFAAEKQEELLNN